MSVAITVDSLSKKYRLGQYQAAYGTLRETLVHAGRRVTRKEHHRPASEIWALRDVSFEVPEGQVLGVIGRNGAGKSTLLKILTRIAFPTEGRAEIRGRVGSLLEVGTGFNQELTGRDLNSLVDDESAERLTAAMAAVSDRPYATTVVELRIPLEVALAGS